MPMSTSNYRLLLEGKLQTDKVEADIKALSERSKIFIQVGIGGAAGGKAPLDDLTLLQAKLKEITDAGGKLTKVVSFENQMGGIQKALITYTNAKNEEVKFVQEINKGVEGTIQRTTNLTKIERERAKIVQQQAVLQAKQSDEMAKAYNYAEKTLERLKSYPKTSSVATAITTATQLKEAVSEKDIARVRELNNQLKLQSATLSKVREGFGMWADHLKHAIVQTVSYSLSLGLVYGALNKLKEGLAYVIELNKEMIKIQVLQQEGLQKPEQVAELADNYNKLAKEMGATTLEVMKGSVEWLRQGKTAKETEELLKATMVMSKLGAIDSATATTLLTATLNGFRLEAEDAMTVVSKLVAVDNIAATSVNELATAMQYGAAVASEAGVSLEQYMAMIAVVSDTTRVSAETIGQAFKTILTRMQQVKAGVDVDEFGESLNNVEKVLKKYGIALRDENLQFRDMGEVIDEVAAKWETYGKTERQQIAEAMAGVRQRNTLLVLMQNYGDVQKYLNAQQESTNLGMERYAIYLTGVEAAQNRLTASFEQLWQKGLNSKSIVVFYNFISGVLELINNLGGLRAILIMATTALLAFNAASVQKAMVSAIANIVEFKRQFIDLIKYFGFAEAAQMQFNLAAMANPYVWIPLAIGAIALLISSIDTAEEKMQKILSRLEESKSKMEDIKNSMKTATELYNRIGELKEIPEESRTTDETEELTNAMNQLKNIFPNLIGYYNEYGDFIMKDTRSLAELNEQLKISYDAQNKIRQGLTDESAITQAKALSEAWLKANNVFTNMFASETKKAELQEEWRAKLNDVVLIFSQMGYESQQAFIKALFGGDGNRGKGKSELESRFTETGKGLAETLFTPLMEESKKAAEDAEKELEGIDPKIKVDIVMSEEEAKQEIEKLTDAVIEMIKDTQEAKKDALEDELDDLERVYDATLERYKDEYDAIKRNAEEKKRELRRELDATMRLLDERKRAIEEELEYYKRIIDAERDRIRAKREQADYDDAQKHKSQELADIEAEIAELALDNSEEAIARRKELEEEAARLKEEMAEDAADHEDDLRLDALDKEEEALEQRLQSKLDELEREKELAQYRHDMAMEAIEDAEYAAEREYELKKESLERQYEEQRASLEAQIELIEDYLADEGQLRKDAKALIEGDQKELIEQLKLWNEEYGKNIEDNIIKKWMDALQAVKDYTAAVIVANDVASFPNDSPIPPEVHHSGVHSGFVGGRTTLKSNEQFAKLMKGELVLNSAQMENFMKNTLPFASNVLPSTTNNIKNGEIQIDMPINVAGNLDKTVLPEMEKIVNTVVKKLNDNLMSRGMNRRAESFSI